MNRQQAITEGAKALKRFIGLSSKFNRGELEDFAISVIDAIGYPVEGEPPPDSERIYPCIYCNTMRTKAEGGTTFTVCDECWGKHHKPNANQT